MLILNLLLNLNSHQAMVKVTHIINLKTLHELLNSIKT